MAFVGAADEDVLALNRILSHYRPPPPRAGGKLRFCSESLAVFLSIFHKARKLADRFMVFFLSSCFFAIRIFVMNVPGVVCI